MATPVQRITQAPTQQITEMRNVAVGLTSSQGFELAQRVAKALASSSLVPKEYQGNLSNCLIGLEIAQRIGASPLLVLQNLIVIHGRPTWSAQFLIATFNGCGKYSSIRYEFTGKPGTDDYGCKAIATELASGEKLDGPTITIGMAKKEGWYNRNGSKWQSSPELMLRYRSAAWFVRTVAPELSMGLQTAEEIHDVYDAQPIAQDTYAVPEQTVEPAAEYQVDTDTGEIQQEPTDDYTDIRLALSDCETLSDLSRVVHDLSKAQQAALKDYIRQRQEEIKATTTQEAA